MKTRVVNLRVAPYDVYIGRSGRGQLGEFGNPYRKGERCARCGKYHLTGESTIPCFQEYFWARVYAEPHFRNKVLALRGKVLGCFCKPGACHGDVIAEWIDRYAP